MEFYIKLNSGGYIAIKDKNGLPEGTELYVKTSEGGFVKYDPSMGEIVTEKKSESPAVQTPDYIKELTGLIRGMSESISKIKEKEEEVQAKIAAYKEMSQKGLPIPSVPIPKNSELADDLPNGTVLNKINLAIQGKELMNKRLYPKYYIDSDEKRYEIAKYMTLFIKAGLMQNARAQAEFWDTYRPKFIAEGKTAVGDSGNLFPVTDMIESEVLAFAREQSVALQYARVVPMTMEKQTYPGEATSTTVSWGNTTNESEATVADVEITASELSAYAAVRNTSLDDSPTDIVSWLFSNMSEAVGLELDNVMFNGDGSSTYGSVSGVFLTAGYSVALDSGSTAFSQVNADAFSQMIYKLDGLKKQGARFFMHGLILHYVRTLKDTNGRPIFLETVGSGVSPTIYGFPYTEAIKCPSTSASNTMFALFGNLRYFLVGRRQGVTSLQVSPYELWTTNRTCFKIYSRWGLGTALVNGLVRLRTSAS